MDNSTSLKRRLPTSSSSFNCFGCALDNVKGLHLSFDWSEKELFSYVSLGKDYESFPGIIHGGIVATILDEVMAQVAFSFKRHPAFTVGMKIRYLQPMRANKSYVATAEITSHEGSAIEVKGKLANKTFGYSAIANGTFFLASPEFLMSDKLSFPHETLDALQNQLR